MSSFTSTKLMEIVSVKTYMKHLEIINWSKLSCTTNFWHLLYYIRLTYFIQTIPDTSAWQELSNHLIFCFQIILISEISCLEYREFSGENKRTAAAATEETKHNGCIQRAGAQQTDGYSQSNQGRMTQAFMK